MPLNNRMEPSRLTVLCDHVAAARGSFGTFGGRSEGSRGGLRRPWPAEDAVVIQGLARRMSFLRSEGSGMAMTKGGSCLLQGLGALFILGSLGAFARSEQGGPFFGVMGGLLIVVGLMCLYFGGKKKRVDKT